MSKKPNIIFITSDIDGKSLSSLITGKTSKAREEIHCQIDNQHMLHNGKYKYLYFVDDGKELLFDNTVDEIDEHDLSETEKNVLDKMRNALVEHLQKEKHEHITSDGILLNLNKKKIRPRHNNGLKLDEPCRGLNQGNTPRIA